MEHSFLRLDPARIDPSDETFRVRRIYPRALLESIRRSGIRTPILVEPLELSGSRYRIVSGWGRWLARPEGPAVPCFVLPEGMTLETLWDLFLRDNERWNVLEAARILDALARVPGLGPDRIVAEKLPLLGLHASLDQYRRHVRLLKLPPAAQTFVEEEDLPLRRALVLGKLDGEALTALFEAARELQLTHNEVGESIERVEEAAHRDGIDPAALIRELRSSSPGKEAFRRALRDRRYPDLARRQAELERLAGALRFTVPVRIDWDPRLERPGVKMTVELADPEAVTELERSLAENREAMKQLLRKV